MVGKNVSGNNRMTPRQLQIWRGEVLTPEKCAAYRVHWLVAARTKLPCEHLLEVVRLAQCDTCCGKGKVRLKVFGCEALGECTLGKQLDDVVCCVTCEQYSPKKVQ